MLSLAPTAIEPTKAWETQAFQHDRQLLNCRFSQCGKFLFAAAADRFVHRWLLETGEHTAFDAHQSWLGGLAFHPDGKRLITADYVGGMHCWNYAEASPKPVWSLSDAHPDAIRTVSLSADGRFIATAGHDQIVRVWSADDGAKLHELSGHESPIYSSCCHPADNSLVTAEQHGIVLHWDFSTGKLVRKLDAGILWADASLSGGAWASGIRSLTFDGAGHSLACTGITELKDGDRRGGNSTVLMLDWKDGKQKQLLIAKGAGYAERAIFHPAGYVISACLTQEHGSVQFWNPRTKRQFIRSSHHAETSTFILTE